MSAVLNTSTWSVRFTLPKGDPRGSPNYAQNMTLVCVCNTVDAAVALVRGEHPGAFIFSVNHKGKEGTLFDPAIAMPALPNGGVSDAK